MHTSYTVLRACDEVIKSIALKNIQRSMSLQWSISTTTARGITPCVLRACDEIAATCKDALSELRGSGIHCLLLTNSIKDLSN